MLTMLGRSLLDSCINCQDFGIETIKNGSLLAKCDKGQISRCLKRYNGSEWQIGYG